MIDVKKVIEQYGPWLDAYIAETKNSSGREELASQIGIFPIKKDQTTIGIIGVNKKVKESVLTALIRLIYIDPVHRSSKNIEEIMDNVFLNLERQNFVRAEGWVVPSFGK